MTTQHGLWGSGWALGKKIIFRSVSAALKHCPEMQWNLSLEIFQEIARLSHSGPDRQLVTAPHWVQGWTGWLTEVCFMQDFYDFLIIPHNSLANVHVQPPMQQELDLWEILTDHKKADEHLSFPPWYFCFLVVKVVCFLVVKSSYSRMLSLYVSE